MVLLATTVHTTLLGHKYNCAEDTESKKAYVIVTPLCNYPLPDTYGRHGYKHR